MSKRYFLFDEEKVDMHDVVAATTMYDDHEMTLHIDVTGESAKKYQDGMLTIKVVCDYDEDQIPLHGKENVKEFFRMSAYFLTNYLSRCMVEDTGYNETVDFRTVFKYFRKMAHKAPFMSDEELSQFVHDLMDHDYYETYLQSSENLEQDDHLVSDMRLVTLRDCTICMNHLQNYGVELKNHALVLTFLGKDGCFFTKRSYELPKYALDDVTHYSRDLVFHYINTFRNDPELHHKALLLDAILETLIDLVYDYQDDFDQFKELADEELNYDLREFYMLPEDPE